MRADLIPWGYMAVIAMAFWLGMALGFGCGFWIRKKEVQ